MSKRKDHTGSRFGEWKVLAYSHNVRYPSGSTSSYWECECSCGTIIPVQTDHLTSGASTRCRACGNRTHGKSKSLVYKVWLAMIQRCTNPNNTHYVDYGGRGIFVCDHWRGTDGFQRFLDDIGERPEDTSLDRIDNEKGYSKSNCKWSTPKEQANNTRKNVFVNFNGKNIPFLEFARLNGIHPNTLQYRMDSYSISPEEAAALGVPKQNKFTTQQIANLVGCSRGTAHLHISKKSPSPKFGDKIDEAIAQSQST